ncbi:hypothetical protein [Ilumatobacter coccineus]|uniref:hypothetical protein n=1 Tax=Ilumatobacter coccineus TaxID=467094 RepID=UPI00138AF321|nr:hypothetical protein [Ilumatobacter coccineus]
MVGTPVVGATVVGASVLEGAVANDASGGESTVGAVAAPGLASSSPERVTSTSPAPSTAITATTVATISPTEGPVRSAD